MEPVGVGIQQFGFIGAPRVPTVIATAITSKAQAIQDAERARNELAKTQADVGNPTGKVTLHVAKAGLRQALGAAIRVELRLVAFEVRHQGHDLEIRGDEVLAVFLSSRHSLRAAVAFQLRLHAELHFDPTLPLHAVIGLDTGEAVPVRDGYRGGALNLAARLCSLAGPGEIFASQGVIHVVRKTAGLDFVDRGEVQLKGLSAPVRVIQIAPEGELPPNLPPIQPILVTHPTNRPDESTPFIGRAKQREEITPLLHVTLIRLMTLTGPGGTGQPRLALHMAPALLAEFRDGAFFVSLASLVDHRHVISAVEDAFGVHESGTQSLHEALLVRLRDKPLLLVLDNFEHALEASTLVSALLD